MAITSKGAKNVNIKTAIESINEIIDDTLSKDIY